MKLLILYRSLFVLTFLLPGLTAQSQVYRKSKSTSNSFKVEKTSELTIKNKYGNIQLISWNKDSVKFEVDIEVRNKKEAKALATLDDIYIDFTASKHFLEARTSSYSSESFWTDIKDKTGNVFSSENKMQIDYIVYLPSTMAITIVNKYGDILMDDQEGAAVITLSNGDLKAHSIMGGASIDLEFAYANIKKMNDARLNLGYKSEITLGNAKNLNIESKSSRIRIESVAKLEIKSHRDKYYINKVGSLNATNSYTYLEIRSLSNYLSMDAKYGNVDIKTIESEVTNLNFNVESTDISFVKPTQRSIDFKLVYDEKAGLYFPEELQNKTTAKKDEEKKLVETVGQLGSSGTNPLKVEATLVAGNIRVDVN